MTYVEFIRKVESTSWHQPNQRLLHAAMGLCTEVGELFEIESDEHMVEEMGDVFWYLALAHDAVGLDFDAVEIDHDFTDFEPRGETPLDTFTIYATELLDMVKKQIFYGRAIDMKRVELTLFTLKMAISFALDEQGIKVIDILQANVNKLSTRYPEKFTEDAAINRDVKAEYAAMSR